MKSEKILLKLLLLLLLGQMSITCTAQCWTFWLGPTSVFDEPGGLPKEVDGHLAIDCINSTQQSLTAVLTTNHPNPNLIQVSYNSQIYNFVNGECNFLGLESLTDFDLLVDMYANAPCAQIYNIRIEIKATGFPTDPGNPNDNFNLIRPKIAIAGPAALCANASGTFTAIPPLPLSGQYTYTLTGGTGWQINGITTNTLTTPSTSVGITAPSGYNGNTTLTITNPDISCGGTKYFCVGLPTLPGSITWTAAGNTCYYNPRCGASSGATSYYWEWGFGTGTSYPNSQTTTANELQLLLEPSTVIHVRVRSVNSCGNSSWRTYQGSTPINPPKPNCQY